MECPPKGLRYEESLRREDGQGRQRPEISIRLAESKADYVTFGRLVRDYIASLDFNVDFQDTQVEMDELGSRYGIEGRGAALLALSDGQSVGVTGLRDIGQNRCELKRMYVIPPWQGHGIGRLLCDKAIAVARELGYRAIRLDTLERMPEAAGLYSRAGFRPVAPYYHNPLPDALFLELTL